MFGILDVNAWHNLVHIATGVLGLALFRIAAREYALGLGAVYLVVAVLGFIIGAMVTRRSPAVPRPHGRRARRRNTSWTRMACGAQHETIMLDWSVIAISNWAVSNRFYREVVGADVIEIGRTGSPARC